MFPRLTCLAACLLLSSTAFAQMPDDDQGEGGGPDPRVMKAHRGYHARVAASLAQEGTPRGLAIAALMLPLAEVTASADAPEDDTPSQAVPVDPRVARWRELASERAGSDAVANALIAAASESGSEADAAIRREAVARWRRAEPDNLAPLLTGGEDVLAALADAATLTRFDLHFYGQTRAIAAALRAHPPTDTERALLVPDGAPLDEVAAISASAIVAASSLPSLQPLFDACRPPALASTPTRADDCRRVADAMRTRSDTALGESIGLSLARRLATTPETVAEVDAAGRAYAWRMQQWREVSAAQPRGGAAEFVRLLADPAIDREQQLAERVLRGAGVSLTPPEGWQPTRPD